MKLSDFGIAVIADATQSHTGTRGSYAWLAPEVIDPDHFGLRHAQSTFASDIYSFACVCVEVGLFLKFIPQSQTECTPFAIFKLQSTNIYLFV